MCTCEGLESRRDLKKGPLANSAPPPYSVPPLPAAPLPPPDPRLRPLICLYPHPSTPRSLGSSWK